jgi:TolB-like protein
MKSDTPEWRWLEKGLADRIATDFVQNKAMTVVARDEMQVLAEKMKWVPEMAVGSAPAADQLRKTLRITHVVTGVYTLAEGRLKIVGQIVDLDTRAEVARREVAGKPEDALELQRQLSAEILTWFVKQPPAQVLEGLPVWTRSLPAARALYEGLDLYDQGRYGEAWLEFRQASRADPTYLEAQYWVGKMYYFMNRYEHARRTMEKFVYLDAVHPRLGDALVEYVHSYESSSPPPEVLLALYDQLSRRFPWAEISDTVPGSRQGKCQSLDWFTYRKAQLLGQIGRHKEAAALVGRGLDGMSGLALGASPRLLNLMEDYALTGAQPDPAVLFDPQRTRKVLAFKAGDESLTWTLPEPERILGKNNRGIDKWALGDTSAAEITLGLAAPDGYVFKSLRFFPLVEGDEVDAEVSLYALGTYVGFTPCQPPQAARLKAAPGAGVSCDRVPRTGILFAKCKVAVVGPQGGPVTVKGCRVAPTLEKVGDCGAIDLACEDTSSFRAEVDGLFARWLPGTIGLLTPGKHQVTLRPVEANAATKEWTTTVTVHAGQVTRVMGRLPPAEDGPFAAWTTTLVGRGYAGYDLGARNSGGAPTVYAEAGALHLVWSHSGDLWTSMSTDGKTFTPATRLPLPVSTGWSEVSPRLLRDEAGRFVLTFLSNRGAPHKLTLYLCWSRDFSHWSAPVQVSDQTMGGYDILQDDRGRLLVACTSPQGITVLASRDGLAWGPLSVIPCRKGFRYALDVAALQRADGRYEVFVTEGLYSSPDQRAAGETSRLLRYVSGDGLQWPAAEVLADFGQADRGGICGVHAGGRSLLARYVYDSLNVTSSMVLFTERADGSWQESEPIRGVPAGRASLAFHPRWGFLLAALTPEGHEWFPHPSVGPFLMRGPSLTAPIAVRPAAAQPGVLKPGKE